MHSMPPNQDRPVCRDAFLTVIIYENANAMTRALPVFQRLIHEFAADTDFNCIWVSYDNLSAKSVRDHSATYAAHANMIVFSTDSAELPREICDWVEGWLPSKDLKESALVALVGDGTQHPVTPAYQYLQRAATRATMDFLSPSETHSPAEAETPSLVTAFPARAIVPNHWGINE